MQAFLEIRTSVDNALFDAAPHGLTYGDLDVFAGPQVHRLDQQQLARDRARELLRRQLAAGVHCSPGVGYVGSKLNGTVGCATQLTFLG